MFNYLKELNEFIAMLKHDINEIEKNKPHENETIEEFQAELKMLLKNVLEQRKRHIIFGSTTLIFMCGVVVSLVNIFIQNSLLQVTAFSINAIGCMIVLPFVDKSMQKYYWALLIVSFVMIANAIDIRWVL